MSIKKRRPMRWAACLVACLLVFSNIIAVTAQEPQGRVLKVAFPELKGISETDQYGIHKGLLVDYLNEIAKYTGWKYEYVPVENDDVVTNFLDGQYDLMGGAYYSPSFEEYFAYPSYNMGRSRAVLLCRKDDERLLSYDLSSLNGKVIGVYENASDKIRYLEEFLSGNDLDCTLHYYSYEDMKETGNLYRQLRTGEVDILLGNDQEIGGEFRMVASFQAQPYYIVTTVGNSELLEGLNTALRYILESTPNFAEEVYNANFPDVRITDIQLNDQELRYIKEKGTVTVAVPSAWHPLYCVGSHVEQHEGMLPELAAEITGFTGLDIRFITADTYAESIRMVREGEADVLGAYLGGGDLAFSSCLALSQPYISLNGMLLKHKSVDYPGNGLICGILSERELPPSLEAAEVREYDTPADLVKAVDTKEVDYIYGVAAMLEKEMQRHRYVNVVPVSQTTLNTDVSFAVARPVEPELLTILNKAVANLSSEERNAMLNRNLVSMGYSSLSLQEIIYASPVAFVLILGCVLMLIMAVFILILRNKTKGALMLSRLEAAEAKSVAKSEFLSHMSHEIRTPMNAIVGLTELAIMERDVPAGLAEKLEKIRGSSQYLLSLINDILDMARIENGKVEIERKEFSLSEVLEELENMMAPHAQQKGLRFRVLCPTVHDQLVGDPLRLRQVLTNLLSNAVKFTPAGGEITLRVEETACDKGTAEYRFSVADTGIGIAKEDQERIFTAFEQLSTSNASSAGTGLGLPISRSMARLMGGDLKVKSEQGKGSVFYMTLSFTLGVGIQPQAPAHAEREKDLKGLRVLLAEDNDLNAEIARELLCMQGVQVSRASDGREAVELYLASDPWFFQAVLMDIRMPVMDGHEAARTIRASGRDDAGLPIIAMTANSFKEDEAAARAAGMDGFVPKPIDVNYLLSILREVSEGLPGGPSAGKRPQD